MTPKKAMIKLWIGLSFLLASFATAGEGVRAVQTLTGDRISLSFETVPDLRLAAVSRTGTVVTFDDQPIWKLCLRDDQGGLLYVEAAGYSHTFSFEKNSHLGYEELIGTWTDLVVNASNRIARVTVTVILDSDAFFAKFSIDVETDLADYSLYNVSFPELYIDPIGGDGSDDFLTLPKHGGYILDDPVHRLNPTGYPHPGYWSMQFFTLFDDSGLLYLGTDDVEGFFKLYGLMGDGQHLYWRMENIPEDHTLKGVDYAMPYAFRLGLMPGDWRSAAARYRKWALEHLVTRKPMADPGTDFPAALRDAEAVAVYYLGDSDDPVPVNFGLTPAVLQGIRDSKTFFDLDRVAVLLYQWYEEPGIDIPPWPEVTPMANMAPGIAQLHADGDLCAAFMYASMTYDPVLPSFLDDHFDDLAIKDLDGNIVLYGDAQKALMDLYTPAWQDFTRDWCLDCTQAMDLDGLYFDVWSSVNFLDYDPSHGHSLGGGSYHFQGKKEQGRIIRQSLRQVPGKEGWFLSSEFPQEFLVDELEMVMWNLDQWDPGLGQAPAVRIPLFETVFGDRQIVYSARQTFFDTLTSIWHNDLMSYLYAARLSLGFTLGFTGSYLDTYGPGAFPGALDSYLFLRKLLGLERYARSYLLWGEAQRPVRVTAVDAIDYETLRKLPDPTGIDMGQVPHCWVYTPSYPEISKVIPSVWQARDGSIAIVLVNWWNESLTIDYTFRFEDYDLLPGGVYGLYSLDEGGTQFMEQVKGDFSRSDTVEGRGVKVLLIRLVVPVEGPGVPGRAPSREGASFQVK